MKALFDHDDGPDRKDLALALVFLTRIPWPWQLDAERPIGRAAWAFPVIGAGLGLLAGVVWLAASSLGVSALVAATLVIACLAIVTGALHEDGLADCADGIGSGQRGAAAIKIMRDSRLGTHGVVALGVVLILRIGALSDWPVSVDAVLALAALQAGSRGLMLLPALICAPAATAGLAAGSDFRRSEIYLALVLAAGFGAVVLPMAGFLVAAVIAAAAVFLLTKLVNRQIGGYTGDVMGAAQQGIDTIGLIALASFLNGH